jgi:hypothetical protein
MSPTDILDVVKEKYGQAALRVKSPFPCSSLTRGGRPLYL